MTTSATGDRARSGFTLLEVLLALGLIAVLSAAMIGVSSNLLSERNAAPEDVFWKAAEAARRAALKSGREVDLSFDDKSKAFAINDGATTRVFPVPKADPNFSVIFLGPESTASSAILIGGTLLETGGLAHVAFYNDGTCSPFRVQFRAKNGAKAISIDPWTCAQVLTAPDANGN
jgi:general secretion pathway protein H